MIFLKLFKKYSCISIISVLIIFLAGEILARYLLGLGNPPLSIIHPSVEYMFKPNQDLHRFGNRIINQYGMRTTPFTLEKEKDELRVMIFGDSVLNGGNQTDHTALATTILQNALREKFKKVIIGNISAGSWGPGNWLAYGKEYGFFEADVVAVIISSHDYNDNPTFQKLNNNTHPTKKPFSALQEVIIRYLPRYLPVFFRKEITEETDRLGKNANAQDPPKGLDDLRYFLELAKSSTKNVIVIQHWEKSEIEKGTADLGNKLIQDVCHSVGIEPISLEPSFRQSIQNGTNPYRDNIHPNDMGQRLIAEMVLDHLPKFLDHLNLAKNR